MRVMCRLAAGLAVLTMLAASCRPAPPVREYPLVGQVLAVDGPQGKVTIRHQDIAGFMPGMTMAFPVREKALIADLAPGSLVTATLAVQDTTAWIARLTVTGHAPLPTDVAPTQGLGPGDQVADAALVDQDGHAFSLSRFKGHASVVSFIYTRCPIPDYCPAIETRIGGVTRAIGREPALTGVRVGVITIDPAHDTPAVLKAHAVARGLDLQIVTYLTGTPEAIDTFGRQFGLAVTRAGASASIDHNLRTVIMDPQLRITAVLTGADWTVDEAVRSLEAAATP